MVCNEIFIRVSDNTDAERNDCSWIFVRLFFNHTGQKSRDNGNANKGPPGPPGPPGMRGPKGKQLVNKPLSAAGTLKSNAQG